MMIVHLGIDTDHEALIWMPSFSIAILSSAFI